MEKSAIDVNGLFMKENGETFSPDSFFEELKAIGYTFTGSIRFFEKEKINQAIVDISESFDDSLLEKMVLYFQQNGEETLEDIELFLLSTTGTGTFHHFIKTHLRPDLIPSLEEFSNCHWEISDSFESDLSHAVFQKIKSYILKKNQAS